MNLTAEQISNAKLIRDALNNVGVSDRLLQCAIASVCWKESGLMPVRESMYYSKERIVACWPKIKEDVAIKLEHNEKALGDFLYGGKYGNGPTEGYKNRGAFFNQLTFHDNFVKYGVNVDKANDPKECSAAPAKYFKDVFNQGVKLGSFKKFGVNTLLDVKSSLQAIQIAVQSNAGLGTKWENGLVQEGFKKSVYIYPTIDKVL